MKKSNGKRRLAIVLLPLGVLGLVLFLGGGGLFTPRFNPMWLWAQSETEEAYNELESIRHERLQLIQGSGEESEVRKKWDDLAARESRLRTELSLLVERKPSENEEVHALYLLAGEWPDSSEGVKALAMLPGALENSTADELVAIFETNFVSHTRRLRPIVPQLLRLERGNAKHPGAAKLLTQACLILAPSEGAASASEEFKEVADLLLERHATSPKLANFCELLGRGDGSPQWAQPFEGHLKRILEVNQDRFVRCTAKIALASVVQEAGKDRQDEARRLYEEFLEEFDGKTEYPAMSIEEMCRRNAIRSLEIIDSHGLGKEAPETVGVDLDGGPMSLTDYRGKVVLVSFWATWCSPCMRMIPHEIGLIERFGSDRFAIVGVNADGDLEKARSVAEKIPIPWRSFQNEEGRETAISNQWHVTGYPTLYLLDIKGVVRKRWIGEPSWEVLTGSIGQIFDEESPMASTSG